MLAEGAHETARRRIIVMISVALLCLGAGVGLTYIGIEESTKPPAQPVGPYRLLERQEGENFFKYYKFYEGPDSVGSHGYNSYVSRKTAESLGIVNVTYETDELDVYGSHKRHASASTDSSTSSSSSSEPFIYMGSASTKEGPRESIRLEGIRRFDRGLFIIDIRHMPNGCGGTFR